MFGHIHLHTMYSLLDGMGKPEEIAARAKALGQTFCAITDHGSTNGLYHFQKACDNEGIKPILGTEFYCTSNTSDRKSGHIIVLAKNSTGLANMFKLQEYAYTVGFKWKPRIDLETLEKYKEGLIVTSACLANPINQYIMQDQVGNAIAEMKAYQKAFGDNFYLEIQPNALDEQKKVNSTLIDFASSYGLQLVAANDVHYVEKDDWYPHEVLLAMQTKKKMDDERRFKFPSTDFWLRSEQEMYDAFAWQKLDENAVQTAINNTQVIADKCNARIEKGNYLPKYYDIPDNSSPRQLLTDLVKRGIGKKNYEAHIKDIEHEIDVIDEENLCDYFLIVQDYIEAARKANIIVGEGRGSGAGSKASYCLDIHRVDPHKYNLLFERFMAKGRHPDIDVDFSDQDFVFHDLQKKYGKENVAHVVTYGTMTPKAVCRKVFNTFNHTMAYIKQINRHINEGDKSVVDALKRSKELRAFEAKHPDEFRVIKRLEGVISHEGKHAGGIVIYEGLSSLLPIKTESADDRQGYIVGFDKYMLEELGFWKFDVLGLETLPIIKRCLTSIKNNHGVVIDLHTIDYEDEAVYDDLSKGDVSGVFQLANQSSKTSEQGPDCFDDIIAINALIRPQADGFWEEYIARRNGKPWSVIDARIPYMKDTFGMMAYQEQYLLDGHILAGWDIAYADKHLRKNKDIRNDVELRDKFFADSIARGYFLDDLVKVWQEIEDAVDSGYSFNKSHSASYAITSYQTAWLKHYYPNEFYASLMTSKGDDQSEIAGYIAEAKKRGITILPPDINYSDNTFSPTERGVRYRITTISHVGDTAINDILRNRPYSSFSDFCERRSTAKVKANSIVNLIKAGAFDGFGERHELLWQWDMSLRNKTQIKNDVQCDTYEDSLTQRLEWEKEALGMYLSAHPMDKYSFKPMHEFVDNGPCFTGGEVMKVATALQKNGKEMAFVDLDTQHGVVRVLVFAQPWSQAGNKVIFEVGNTLLVRGRRSGNSILFGSGEVLM